MFRNPLFASGAAWSLALATTALTGCDRGQVQEYRVAKESPATQAQSQAGALPPGHPGVGTPAAPSLKYTMPAGWQEAPPGQMRVASFRVGGKDGKQADVSVVPLPGLAGSDLANVNRWREQVGLGGVDEAELAKLAQPVEIAGVAANLYEQAGVNAGSGEKARILAAITRRDGTAWFFKMTGDDALVAEQKPAFVEFLKSVNFPLAAQSQLPPSHPPIDGAGMMPPATASAADSGQAKPNWEVPSAWKEIPGGQFLVAKFVIGDAAAQQANVNVSMSPGDGGGLLANVNRWRGQIGLPALADADLAKDLQTVELAGGKASVADFNGVNAANGQKVRVIAVVVPRGGNTWFYKLMGADSVVQQQKEAFLKFVQSVKY